MRNAAVLELDHVNSRPADVLVQGWDRGKPVAFDVTVASPLTPVTLNNASTSVRAAAYAAELRKHVANDTRCQELGWTCIPLAVETYGNWGMEAQSVFSRLASLLAIGQAIPKPKMLSDIYGHLNMSLVRSVARAIMRRENVRIALHKLVSSIDADDGCFDSLLQAWYLDIGVLAGIHSTSNKHLVNAISRFKTLVSPSDVITIDAILSSPSQQALSKKLDSHLFNSILMTSSPANKPHLLSSSAPYASSWLPVVPWNGGEGCVLSYESLELAKTVQWRRERAAGDIVIVVEDQEAYEIRGRSLSSYHTTLKEASIHEGAAALAAGTRKHAANDARCQALGWTCIHLAVETFGNWGKEAWCFFSRLATLLALRQGHSKSTVVNNIYGCLNLSLVRSVARSIMGTERVG
eukprot:Em0010g309a